MKQKISELKMQYLEAMRTDWRAYLDANEDLKAALVRRSAVQEKTNRIRADISEFEEEKAKALEMVEEIKRSFGSAPAMQAHGRMEAVQIKINSLDHGLEACRKLLAPGSELATEVEAANREIAQYLRATVCEFTRRYQALADEKRADCLSFLTAFPEAIGPVWNEFGVEWSIGFNSTLSFGGYLEFERFMALPARHRR